VPLLPKAFGIEHGLVELCFCEKTLLLWRSLRLEAIVLLFQLLKPLPPVACGLRPTPTTCRRSAVTSGDNW
jgi:hypothetical protein